MTTQFWNHQLMGLLTSPKSLSARMVLESPLLCQHQPTVCHRPVPNKQVSNGAGEVCEAGARNQPSGAALLGRAGAVEDGRAQMESQVVGTAPGMY